MKKKLFLVIVLAGTLVLVAGGYYFLQYQKFLNTPVFSKQTVINISKGQSFRDFIVQIKKQNATGENWQWQFFAKIEKAGGWLTVGEFLIKPDMTPMLMMKKIKSNKVISYNFTIIEGTTWRELKNKLLDHPVLIHELNDITEASLKMKLQIEYSSLEGMFLPETYQFVRGDTDLDILQRAHQALKTTLDDAWAQQKPGLPLNNPYQLLILASIVEKETSLAQEREKIAGVFIRRLQKDMRLQTDPTVIYGLGEKYDGDIKNKDLSTDTPYNTYTRKGLPPTPIAMVGKEAIHASGHPDNSKALYFVANNRGGHYFSDTYEQHQKAVKDYLKGIKL